MVHSKTDEIPVIMGIIFFVLTFHSKKHHPLVYETKTTGFRGTRQKRPSQLYLTAMGTYEQKSTERRKNRERGGIDPRLLNEKKGITGYIKRTVLGKRYRVTSICYLAIRKENLGVYRCFSRDSRMGTFNRFLGSCYCFFAPQLPYEKKP